MIFSSWQFLFLFLPIVFFVYFFLTKKRLFNGGKLWLVLASLFFYGYWQVEYLVIIMGSLLFNFALGSSLSLSHEFHNKLNRKTSLVIGITANILLLGYFKYVDFFIENINSITSYNISLPNVVLPLAISFFTFQQIAYLVDSYKGETSEYDLLNYMLFVTFFPQLIAGPIVHHHEMMKQFQSKWNLAPRHKNILAGVLIFSIGLFKKVVIADTFAIWADMGFSSLQLGFFEAWATSLSYTFQLYFDFSGYCDMAMGAALLFNIWLPINFNSPYKAFDIQDFWRRWHITLGRFLRDYIYIPLGGNKNKNINTYCNIFITFLIGGLWHGASWMFVIWGALHGLALVLHRFWKNLGGNLPDKLAWFVTFSFINLTWIFFRAEDLSSAFKVIRGMFDFSSMSVQIHSIPTEKLASLGGNVDWLGAVLPNGLIPNIFQFVLIVFTFFIISKNNSIQIIRQPLNTSGVVFCSFLFSIAVYVMISSSSSAFLYFNF